jgi:signal peptidase I
MKKLIVLTILFSTMSVSAAFAGEVPGGILNPLWLPVTILSSVAEVTAPPHVVYSRRTYYEPGATVVYREPQQTVMYERPRHDRHDYYNERRSSYYYNNDYSRSDYSRSYDRTRYNYYR